MMASLQQIERIKENRIKRLKEKEEILKAIINARKIQKSKVDYNVMQEQLTQKELEKFGQALTKPLTEFHKPIVKEVEKIQRSVTEGIVPAQLTAKELRSAIEQGSKETADAIEGSNKKMIEYLKDTSAIAQPTSTIAQPTSTIAQPTSTIAQLPSTSSTKPLSIDPDKGLDLELLNYYKYVKPSELLNESNPEELVDAYITEINLKLKSYGGMIRSRREDSEEYKQLRRKIDGLRAYKDRIKQIPGALTLSSQDEPRGVLTGSGLHTYRYYSSIDELLERLSLLCGSKEAGNNSPEIRNEIVEILDILLNKGVIDKDEHKLLYYKWS